MSDILVIYHQNCPDGFGAAYAAWRVFGDKATYQEANYGEPPPDVENKDVFVVDFCYPPEVLKEMDAKAKRLVVLDHHATWVPRVQGLTLKEGSELVLDMERSGAGLAWDYFHPGTPRPYLIDCVEDRDLWRFVVPDSAAFLMHLDTEAKSFEVWHQIALMSDAALQQFVALGKAMDVKFEQLCADCVQKAMPIQVQGVAGLAVTVSGDMVSRVGALLAEQSGTFGLCWSVSEAKDLKLSFRSQKGGLAKQLAEALGGGGHPNAAAARLPLERLIPLLSNQL